MELVIKGKCLGKKEVPYTDSKTGEKKSMYQVAAFATDEMAALNFNVTEQIFKDLKVGSDYKFLYRIKPEDIKYIGSVGSC